MVHSHQHGLQDEHSHSHQHGPQDFGRAFVIGIALNTGFVLIEGLYGYLSNSMALIADAGHNLSDVLGLLVAWGASLLAKRLPNDRYTYGLRGSSILAALFNAIFLLVAIGAIIWEALQRLSSPEPIAGWTVTVVAAVGIVINALTAYLFAAGRKGDLNIRGAYLHMLADALVSAGVVVAGVVIVFTNWVWLDPAVSIVIALVIIWQTWGLLKDSVSMSLAGVPAGVELSAIEGLLRNYPHVRDVHDLHVWPMSTTEIALTAHLVMDEGAGDDQFLLKLAARLKAEFGIDHPTIQIERDGSLCPLAPAHVV